MKKINILIIILIVFLPVLVNANSIESINMDIYIDKYGTAHITETWNAYLNQGTEGYKPYYNLGESTISNFNVSLNNTNYTYIDNWNVDGSFDSKKYKNGFNYLDNGIELCFGISNYGTNTYKLSYDISNFVVNTSDGYQMIYWTLFPHNYKPSPGRVFIKIYSDFKYANTLDIWGYGKGGMPTYVYDGVIEMDSEDSVHISEYMTILVKFPNSTFNNNIILDKTFDEYLAMANEGAVHYDSEEINVDKFRDMSEIILISVLFFLPILLIGILNNANSKRRRQYNFGKLGNKVNKNIEYYRDIPFSKNELEKVYWIVEEYNIYKKKEDFLGAILLKWVNEGKIRIIKENRKIQIMLINDSDLVTWEKQLYRIFSSASKNNIVNKKLFKRVCKKNYYLITGWFDNVKASGVSSLVSENMLLSSVNEKYNYDVAPQVYEEAKKIAGLKKFLKDFSNIKDRDVIEVHLWQEYLIYAQIFGIAKKVIKRFKEIYPDVITIDNLDNIKFFNTLSHRMVVISSNAKNRAESRQRARNYSSGGGGFSSSGGGGGSFGGGGGGGGFR